MSTTTTALIAHAHAQLAEGHLPGGTRAMDALNLSASALDAPTGVFVRALGLLAAPEARGRYALITLEVALEASRRTA